MNRSLSVYLDLLRLLAAFGVFLGHVRSLVLPGIPIVIGAHAAQCVAIFFVLSGFVISFVTDGKETSWQAYARARASRLYSVVILSIVVTLIADRIGMAADPVLYAGREGFNPSTVAGEILAYLSFTNQLWFQSIVVGSNEPYWSLGYEVPYYLLFGLACFLRGRVRIAALAIAAAVLGPRIMLYFPLWLMGTATYRIVCQTPDEARPPRILSGAVLFVASGVLFLLVRFILFGRVDNIFHFNGWARFATAWVYFHLIGVAVMLNIIGFAWMTRGRDVWPAALVTVIRWAAGASFTLYLMHLPVLFAVMAWFPQARQTGLGLIAMAAVLGIILLLAELGERRKKLFERWFGALSARVRPSSSLRTAG